MSGWREAAATFALAAQFLTRLPVPPVAFSESRQNAGFVWYPLIGALIGAFGAALLWSASAVLPAGVAALLALSGMLWITGALHEDGLADAADGLGGSASRERALEIMRDSRIGAYGVLSLLAVLGLKFAALTALPGPVAAIALIGAHALSRMAAVHVIATTSYARADAAKFAPPEVDAGTWRAAFLWSLVILALVTVIIGPGALVGAAALILAARLYRRIYLRKLGGYTGDCLGGTQQISETAFYLGLAAWL